MTNRKNGLAICPLGRVKKSHTEDTTDEGGGQKKHRQDLDDSQ